MAGRETQINNITERYLFSPEKGSVGFVAETYLGVTSFLQYYNLTFYKNLSSSKYGLPITESLQAGQAAMIAADRLKVSDTITNYAHAEQTNFFGDPVIALNSFAKPDFAVEDNGVTAPSSVSITSGKFHVKAYLYNIGRALGDSVMVSVQHKLPSGSIETLLEKRIGSIRSMDSLDIDVAIDANKDVGNNEIIVSIDGDNKYSELSENNNSVSKKVYIYANGITPIYPYNYSIIGSVTQSLIASTSDALAASQSYIMELDTTSLFNSPSKITKTIKSIGGAISFDPGISYTDGRVYYWRVSPVTSGDENYQWANSSFQFLSKIDGKKQEGVGQAHLYQHLQSQLDGLILDSVSRDYIFKNKVNSFQIAHGVYGTGLTGWSNFAVRKNSVLISSFECTSLKNSLLFNVFTSEGVSPYFNQATPSTIQTVPNNSIGGFMGSKASCANHPYSFDVDPANYPNTNKYNFQFSYQTESDRDKIAQFMNWIPDGSYVMVRLFVVSPYNTVPFVSTWQADDNGGNTSLYHKFIEEGLTSIDEFTSAKAGLFIFKKSDGGYTPIQMLTANDAEQIQTSPDIIGKDSIGFITSPKFGPAKEWKTVEWSGRSIESTNSDHASVDVLGVTASGDTTKLYTLGGGTPSLDISTLNAKQYPYLQLRMRNVDSINYTPYQLDYWRVLYTPVPEGALAGNIALEAQDTIDLGQDLKFGIAFKNVSNQVYSDSIKATVTIKDTMGKLFTIPVNRLKPLAPGDTAMLRFIIPGYFSQYNAMHPQFSPLNVGTSLLAGGNLLSISLNPDNAPLEQTLDNNSLAQRFFVKSTSVPVEFGKVTATLLSDNQVHLSWQILNSFGSDYYIIQRSVDGKTYKEVGRQKSQGDGTMPIQYSALDDIRSLAGQPVTVFYRIVGVDKEGHNFYSKIVNVHPIWDSWSFIVAPNPITQDKIQLLLSSKESTAVRVRLLDMSGRVLQQQSVQPDSGGHISVTAPHLVAGIYMVQVRQGDHIAVSKVIRK